MRVFFFNENDVRVRPVRKFKATDGVIADPKESNQIVDDIRYHYDNWKKLELDRILKKSGKATTIALTIVTVVIGLSLGLKRSGSDGVRDAKHKQSKVEKLTPAEKKRCHTVDRYRRSLRRRFNFHWQSFILKKLVVH